MSGQDGPLPYGRWARRVCLAALGAAASVVLPESITHASRLQRVPKDRRLTNAARHRSRAIAWNRAASGRAALWLAMAAVGAVLAGLLQEPASVYAATNPVRPPASHTPAPVKLPPSSGEPAPKQPKKLLVGDQPDLRTRFSSTRY